MNLALIVRIISKRKKCGYWWERASRSCSTHTVTEASPLQTHSVSLSLSESQSRRPEMNKAKESNTIQVEVTTQWNLITSLPFSSSYHHLHFPRSNLLPNPQISSPNTRVSEESCTNPCSHPHHSRRLLLRPRRRLPLRTSHSSTKSLMASPPIRPSSPHPRPPPPRWRIPSPKRNQIPPRK